MEERNGYRNVGTRRVGPAGTHHPRGRLRTLAHRASGAGSPLAIGARRVRLILRLHPDARQAAGSSRAQHRRRRWQATHPRHRRQLAVETIVSPLPGWNVRGYSYAELTPDGHRHPGADLNVGYGDEDLGLPVVCFADGLVVERVEWDGASYGYGNVGLIEHRLFGAEETHEAVPLWSLYAHLDDFDERFVPGSHIAAGQPVGTCGKSGNQGWAHLHFELRFKGPPVMPVTFWGGRLSCAAQSALYADPYTLLRLLEPVRLVSHTRYESALAQSASLAR